MYREISAYDILYIHNNNFKTVLYFNIAEYDIYIYLRVYVCR